MSGDGRRERGRDGTGLGLRVVYRENLWEQVGVDEGLGEDESFFVVSPLRSNLERYARRNRSYTCFLPRFSFNQAT